MIKYILTALILLTAASSFGSDDYAHLAPDGTYVGSFTSEEGLLKSSSHLENKGDVSLWDTPSLVNSLPGNI